MAMHAIGSKFDAQAYLQNITESIGSCPCCAACKRRHVQNANCVHLAFLRKHAKWVDARILHGPKCKPCKTQNALGTTKHIAGKRACKMQNAKCVHPCTALQARKMQNARILHPCVPAKWVARARAKCKMQNAPDLAYCNLAKWVNAKCKMGEC